MKYIGVKIVDAEPMNAIKAIGRGYGIGNAAGKGEVDGYEVTYPDGYKSWCPKEAFDKANRPCNAMPFGHAIEALKQGKKVCRAGWNGKGMFLFLLPASNNIPTTVIHDPALRAVIEAEVGGDTFDALGSIRMFTADKKVLTGWLASQTDMLADDWMVVE